MKKGFVALAVLMAALILCCGWASAAAPLLGETAEAAPGAEIAEVRETAPRPGTAGEPARLLEVTSGTCGTSVNWSLDTDTGVLTISGTGAMEDYSAETDVPWHDVREQITSVTVASGVTTIGKMAFYGSRNMTGITLPTGVTSIGSYAFSGCTGLTGITIPSSVTSIGGWAFKDCTGLTGITIPARVTSIGSYAFSGCTGLTGITIPASVTSIGSSAFSGCTGLTEITIPNGVTEIKESTFYNCRGLTAVTIPDSVVYIRDYAFSGCTGLTRVNITDLAAWCEIYFSNAYSNPLTYAHALYLNGELMTDLVIPAGLTRIKSYTFAGASTLTGVTIQSGVNSIGSSAFQNCSGLTSVTVPNSVTSMGSGVFSGCSGLESISLPFVGASSTKSASDTNQYPFGYIFGTTAYKGGTMTRQYYYGSSTTSTTGTDYCIPTSLKQVNIYKGNILAGAFYGCSGLESITFSNYCTATTVGENAFYGCSGLKELAISTTTVTTIGSGAFYNCSSLTSFQLNSKVTSVRYEAFRGCSGLRRIFLPAGLTSISTHAFYGCSALTDVFYSGADKANVTISDSNAPLEDAYWHLGTTGAIVSLAASDERVHLPCAYARKGESIPVTADDVPGYSCVLTAENGSVDAGVLTVEATGTFTTVTVGAVYTPASCTVTFDTGDASVTADPASKSVTYQAAYGELPAPTRAGYTFAGWYTDAEDGDEVTADTVVSATADHTLYAHWTMNTYTVTLDARNGAAATTKSVRYNAAYGELPTPVKPGYTFAGWHTAAEGGDEVTDVTVVGASADLTLHAHWTADTFAITFDAAGGAVSPAGKSVSYGAAYGELPTPVKSGYTFAGWYTAAEGGDPITAASVVALTQAQTLYARWNVNGEDRGTEYRLTGITVRNAAHQSVEAIPTGSFYAEVGVENLASTAVDTVVLASYSAEGRMLELHFVYGNIPLGYTLDFGAGMDNSKGDVAEIRAFVLSTQGNFKPLAGAARFPAQP